MGRSAKGRRINMSEGLWKEVCNHERAKSEEIQQEINASHKGKNHTDE